MRFEERELNVYERFLAEIARVEANGKKLTKAFMTKAEFDEFYQLAMNSRHAVDSFEANSLMSKKIVFGVQIEIEEENKKKKEK